MAYLEDLIAARDNIASQLADITAAPKPTYTIDGQRVDWQAHFTALSRQLDALNQTIQASDPYEFHTTGGEL